MGDKCGWQLWRVTGTGQYGRGTLGVGPIWNQQTLDGLDFSCSPLSSTESIVVQVGHDKGKVIV